MHKGQGPTSGRSEWMNEIASVVEGGLAGHAMVYQKTTHEHGRLGDPSLPIPP